MGDPIAEPLKPLLDRLVTQISGLEQRLDAFIARRNVAIADRASQHVASIVAAAERSAVEIRAAAENDAATVGDRLLSEAQPEVDRLLSEAQADAARIRTEAQADAARIRAEARAQAASAREEAINQANAEIASTCARLSESLQAGATAAIAGIAGGAGSRPEGATAHGPPRAPAKQITDEVEHAVDELQGAAVALEKSLRSTGAAVASQQPTR